MNKKKELSMDIPTYVLIIFIVGLLIVVGVWEFLIPHDNTNNSVRISHSVVYAENGMLLNECDGDSHTSFNTDENGTYYILLACDNSDVTRVNLSLNMIKINKTGGSYNSFNNLSTNNKTKVEDNNDTLSLNNSLLVILPLWVNYSNPNYSPTFNMSNLLYNGKKVKWVYQIEERVYDNSSDFFYYTKIIPCIILYDNTRYCEGEVK